MDKIISKLTPLNIIKYIYNVISEAILKKKIKNMKIGLLGLNSATL